VLPTVTPRADNKSDLARETAAPKGDLGFTRALPPAPRTSTSWAASSTHRATQSRPGVLTRQCHRVAPAIAEGGGRRRLRS